MVGDLPGAAAIIDCDLVDTVSIEDNEPFMSSDRGDTGGGTVVELNHKSKRAQSYPLKKFTIPHLKHRVSVVRTF